MKHIVPILLFCLVNSNLFGQSNYFGAGYGANFGTFNSMKLTFFYQDYFNSRYKNENLNLSKGSVLFFNYSKELNSYLFLDFEYNYQFGDEIKLNNSLQNTIYKGFGSLILSSLTTKINQGSFSPFLKIGIILASFSLDIKSFDNYTKETNTKLYTSDIDFGIHTAIGLEYKIYPSLVLFSELRYNSINLNATRLKMTTEIGNSTSTRNFDLQESNSGTQLLKTSFPFNSLGILVGAKTYF